MGMHLVLTLTGPDRIGIVEHITEIILSYNGNVESSKMAHLGGEFAVLMLIAVDPEKQEKLQKSLLKLVSEGFLITIRETDIISSQKYSGWIPYQVEVKGGDHEGIIYRVTSYLANKGINLESVDTSMVPAPMSGTSLFTLKAIVVAPPDLPYHKWKEELEDVADAVNVTVTVSPYTG